MKSIPLITLILAAFSFCVQGQAINGVTLGNQIWMVENLNVVTFRNGDSIPEVKSDAEWMNAGRNNQPAWCFYNNDSANGVKYGRLYNWFAVSDPRGLAPAGWHVPSLQEWDTLESSLGAGAGKKMKATTGWQKKGSGTNESGFTGLPGGLRYYNGAFNFLGLVATFWGSEEPTSIKGSWGRGLVFYDANILNGYEGHKFAAHSVRCIKD